MPVLLAAALVSLSSGAGAQRASPALGDGPWEYETYEQRTRVRVSIVTRDLTRPWSMAFLPGAERAGETVPDALITEKAGRVRLFSGGRLLPEPVADLADALALDQLFDIALHPDFDANGLVYFTYMKKGDPPESAPYYATTALARGRFVDGALTDVEDVFVANAWSTLFGGDASSITFAPDGHIFMNVSHRRTPEPPQDLASHIGKVLRLTDEGQPAPGNPFANEARALPEIYSYGHRTVMDLAIHPQSGQLWELENGPHGGDEVNVILPGQNYGWPIVTYGRDYDGSALRPWQEGMRAPEIFWVPSITAGSMLFYTGDRFPAWRGNLFVTAMTEGRVPGTGHVQRIVFNENGEIRRERLFTDLRQRMRHIAQGPDGLLYVLTDETDGVLLRIEPDGGQRTSRVGGPRTMSFDALRSSALEVIGGDVARIELTGAGWDACLGQAWNVNDGWARWELTDYRRIIDYAEGASLHTAMRRPAMDPERVGGCGAQPGGAAAPQQSRITAESAWPDQLPIWLTPHGFLRLAATAETSVAADGDGWKVTVRVPRGNVVYTLDGFYDEAFRLRRISTHVDDSIFGDMLVEAELGEYRGFDGLQYPASIVYTQGGLTTFNLAIDSVVPDTDAELGAPGAPRAGGGPAGAGDAPYVELGDGVFVMLGAYQGVAVEFDEFSVVIDGLQNDARSRELIRLTKEAIPGKPIRYVVVTHSHFDHASGLRDFVDEGAAIVTHAANVAFFERALSAPRTLAADESLRRPGGPVDVRGVEGRFVISDDAGQVVELHALEGSLHADDMLIAYLPGTKAIVESDLLQPWINPIFGGGREGPHPYLTHLHSELERLGLDYEQFVPVHRPPEPPTMPKAALLEAVGR